MSEATPSPVRIERQGAVWEITLDRPKANAIDAATSRALGQAFMAYRDDPAARVAILTGGGERFFSAGWDLKDAATSGAEGDYGPGGFAGLTELFDLEKPVIAAINGLAVGGGFELALACDMIVAAEGVEMFLPEATIGVVPDAGGVLRLPRPLPHAIAMEIMPTGKRLPTPEALPFRLGVEPRRGTLVLDTVDHRPKFLESHGRAIAIGHHHRLELVGIGQLSARLQRVRGLRTDDCAGRCVDVPVF